MKFFHIILDLKTVLMYSVKTNYVAWIGISQMPAGNFVYCLGGKS